MEDIEIIMDSNNNNPIRVTKTGTCIYSMIDYMITECETDSTYYPYDSQTCNIVIAGWEYSHNELSFVSPTVVTRFYKENGEWHFTGKRNNTKSEFDNQNATDIF
jgi:hypothetical protein